MGHQVKALAVLTVRNEASFLLEWLAHHRAVGFTDFLVLSNDCDDGTDTMLERLAALGLLTHIRNDGPFDKRGIQFTALNLASKHPLAREADWIMALDIDEFVNIHVGDHTLQALLKTLPEATAITLTWRLFGNADQVRYSDTPVTRQFTRAAPAVMNWPWRAAMFKTLYKNDGTYGKIGVHRPRQPDTSKLGSARWYDGQGRALGEDFTTKRIFSDYGRDNYGLVQLNHYALGTMEGYLVKADRGRAVHSDHMLDVDYWVERNYNTDEDKSILALDRVFEDELTALKSDKVLDKLHAKSVAWRQKRISQLMDIEPYRALFGRLLQTPPSRPVPPEYARLILSHSQISRTKP
ncbi:glycosyltransferase family 2 protein [Lentibacter sp. XHP0401]|jgi:Glycosyl transferase family 2|uniref:glycosyltransferase family 2 protein n=1 Tax=Lentibacter sp. XHP0401 TaxID=2984334 RepID=UPI0021E96A5D|nr:glycosyltransferase family 2 protein [Lentibacter sp. XHP0401]MCV2891873.1 glycosyltransferase family 2 protein [Lentibacter sp. XHP0401]